MYGTIRELEERQFLSIKPSDSEDNEFMSNPLDLLDQEKLLSDLERKKSLFQGRIHDKNDDIKETDIAFDKLQKLIYELSEQNIHRMMTELETGGNIRFEEGKPNDKWYTSCDDLIRSRFDADIMKKKFNICDITVLRVTRIHNRFLRNRFEEKIEQLMDLTNSMQKKSIEYLFYGIDPALPNEIYRAMEEGFRMPSEYSAIGLNPDVSLVNSVICAETPRITTFMKGGVNTSTTMFQTDSLANLKKIDHMPSGHILICKVFYPGSKYITIETSTESSKKKTWHVNDPGLIMPEYL